MLGSRTGTFIIVGHQLTLRCGLGDAPTILYYRRQNSTGQHMSTNILHFGAYIFCYFVAFITQLFLACSTHSLSYLCPIMRAFEKPTATYSISLLVAARACSTVAPSPFRPRLGLSDFTSQTYRDHAAGLQPPACPETSSMSSHYPHD